MRIEPSDGQSTNHGEHSSHRLLTKHNAALPLAKGQ